MLDNHLLRDRMPGLPLLLAPWLGWAQPPFNGLKLVALAAAALSCLLLWELLRPWLEPWPRFAVLILYAFNPLVAEYAGRVMTAPVFTLSVLVSFLLLRSVSRGGWIGRAWLLGLTLGAAAIIRAEGLLLLPAVALGLWTCRQRRPLAAAMAPALAAAAAFYGGNLWAHRRFPTRYLQVWAASVPHSSPLRNAAAFVTRSVWVAVLGARHFPESLAACAAAALSAVVLAVLFVRGLRRLEEERPGERSTLRAVFTFFFLYLLTHALWPVADPRFFLALLPFALAAMAKGLCGAPSGAARPGAGRRWVWAGLGVWLLSYGTNHAQALLETARRPRENRAPAATLSWLRANSAPSAKVWSFADAAIIELYTARPAVSFPPPPDKRAFQARLLGDGVGYVYYAPLRVVFEPLPVLREWVRRWEQSRSWASSSPDAFKLLYADAEEGTFVYEVLPPVRPRR
ncbi:MAG: hypothetical protein NTX64_06630 [Elusimicrobia bacterium]|nr:hypothetical protein [Elusimicrobiota bacterium]